MFDDMNVMVIAWKNMGYLCDIEVIMGLTCIMPLVEVVHAFKKFAQSKNNFVHYFVTFVKM
jgi:hypothetical protein